MAHVMSKESPPREKYLFRSAKIGANGACVALFALGSLSFPVVAAGSPLDSTGSTNSVTLDLPNKNPPGQWKVSHGMQNTEALKPLSGERIKRKFIEKTMIPYPNNGLGAGAFSETFLKYGKWIVIRAERGLRHFEGTWYVENNQLCVQAKDISLICRIIYIGNPKNVLITYEFKDPDRRPIEVTLVDKMDGVK